jgi:hypothetical protein
MSPAQVPYNLALARTSRPRVALFTVFILREDILFLEEWLEHHLRLGVDRIFIYDNSKVQYNEVDGHQGTQPSPKDLKEGSISKYGVNFAELVDETTALTLFADIRKRFAEKLDVREWSPIGPDGRVHYGQIAAINDFVEKYRYDFDYTLHLDCDEFLVSPRGLSIPNIIHRIECANRTCGLFSSRTFDSRFTILHRGRPARRVLSIENAWDTLRGPEVLGGTKALFRMNAALPGGAEVHGCATSLGSVPIDPEDMLFHHYQGRGRLPERMETNKYYPGVDRKYIHRIVNHDAYRYL